MVKPEAAAALEASWQASQQQTHSWAEEFIQRDPGATGAAVDAAASAEELELRRAAGDLLREVDDPKFRDSEFMEFMRQLGQGEVKVEGNRVVPGDAKIGDADGAWAEAQAQAAAAAPSLSRQWAGEFAAGGGAAPAAGSQQWDEIFEKERLGAMDTASAWAEEFAAQSGEFAPPGAGLGDAEEAWAEAAREAGLDAGHAAAGSAQHGYAFEVENPFLTEYVGHDAAIAAGTEALMSGALSVAILWFEAAVQREPERADGWEQLGLCQAENEQEVQAIAALREGVRLDPARSTAHLALAVSLTNELRYTEAYDQLEAALGSHPAYADLMERFASQRGAGADGKAHPSRFVPLSQRHNAVRDAYIEAALRSPDALDADVQAGLGVIFNISHDYGKAVDCFEAALQSRPDDFGLWNKLGATLANGDRSAEAVEAYRRALELRPGYIRARYNLGISCINLKAYRDAAEHFLGALKLQKLATPDSTRRNMSETIWQSLRTALLMANQPELAALASERDVERFRTHFDF